MQEQDIEPGSSTKAISAYHELESSLREIPRHELVALPPRMEEALSKARIIAMSAEEDREGLAAVYRAPPIDAIDDVWRYLQAVQGAILVNRERNLGGGGSDVERAKKLRARHVALLRAIFFGDETMDALLTQTVLGPRPVQTGSALSALAALEREHWPLISATGLISEGEVAELHRLGQRISRSSGAPRREPERRAWTRLVESCRRLRDHAFILYADDLAEWRRRYPAL